LSAVHGIHWCGLTTTRAFPGSEQRAAILCRIAGGGLPPPGRCARRTHECIPQYHSFGAVLQPCSACARSLWGRPATGRLLALLPFHVTLWWVHALSQTAFRVCGIHKQLLKSLLAERHAASRPAGPLAPAEWRRSVRSVHTAAQRARASAEGRSAGQAVGSSRARAVGSESPAARRDRMFAESARQRGRARASASAIARRGRLLETACASYHRESAAAEGGQRRSPQRSPHSGRRGSVRFRRPRITGEREAQHAKIHPSDTARASVRHNDGSLEHTRSTTEHGSPIATKGGPRGRIMHCRILSYTYARLERRRSAQLSSARTGTSRPPARRPITRSIRR
jgi:hypothetical protein